MREFLALTCKHRCRRLHCVLDNHRRVGVVVVAVIIGLVLRFSLWGRANAAKLAEWPYSCGGQHLARFVHLGRAKLPTDSLE